jgi:hypothetical protein
MYPFPICKRTIDNWRYLPDRGPAVVKSKGRVYYTLEALKAFGAAGGVLRQGRGVMRELTEMDLGGPHCGDSGIVAPLPTADLG